MSSSPRPVGIEPLPLHPSSPSRSVPRRHRTVRLWVGASVGNSGVMSDSDVWYVTALVCGIYIKNYRAEA